MSKQWGDLDKLSKRAGISKALGADGLRYFVKECVAAEAPPQAVSQFFSRIRDRRQRMLAVRALDDDHHHHSSLSIVCWSFRVD